MEDPIIAIRIITAILWSLAWIYEIQKSKIDTVIDFVFFVALYGIGLAIFELVLIPWMIPHLIT